MQFPRQTAFKFELFWPTKCHLRNSCRTNRPPPRPLAGCGEGRPPGASCRDVKHWLDHDANHSGKRQRAVIKGIASSRGVLVSEVCPPAVPRVGATR